MASQVSISSLICMGITAIICLLLPITFLFIWKLKYQLSFKPMCIGAGIYLIFSFFLESLFTSYILYTPHALSDYLWEHSFAYALYGCLSASLFQDIGYFFAMKKFQSDFPTQSHTLFFGIGFGGLEMLFLGFISMWSALSLSFSINSSGLTSYLETFPDMQSAALSLINSPAYLFLLTGYERILIFILRLDLSIFIYTAVSKKKYFFLFPTAILLHALFLLPTLLSQRAVFGTGNEIIIIIEGILTIFISFITLFTFWVSKKFS